MLVALVVLGLLAWPLGRWLAIVAEGRLPQGLAPFCRAETALYRAAGFEPWGCEPLAVRVGEGFVCKWHMGCLLQAASSHPTDNP